jgi:hypothetical protein
MVKSGETNSSTAYNNEKDGIVIIKRIKVGIMVQIISKLVW